MEASTDGVGLESVVDAIEYFYLLEKWRITEINNMIWSSSLSK